MPTFYSQRKLSSTRFAQKSICRVERGEEGWAGLGAAREPRMELPKASLFREPLTAIRHWHNIMPITSRSTKLQAIQPPAERRNIRGAGARICSFYNGCLLSYNRWHARGRNGVVGWGIGRRRVTEN